MKERFYLLEIELIDIKPAIWRHSVVPAGITLDEVIQIVMGWADCSLYEFNRGNVE